MQIIRSLVLLLLVSCMTTNEEGRRALVMVSDDQMNQLGAQSYQEMLQKSEKSSNTAARDMMVRVGKRIAAASGAKFDWEFNLIKDPAVNAFCLPGGKVGVYEGILPIAANEAGLAAIMGHEVAHATLKHGAERVSQGVLLQAGLSAADLFLSRNEYRGPILAALGLGSQVGVLLPYSRLQEAEADKLGLTYLAKAGYDPNEAPKLWLRMAKLSDSKGAPPEILSTHPDPVRRSKLLSGYVKDVMPLYSKSPKHPSKAVPVRGG